MPPVIPGVMSDSRYEALRKLFENTDKELQRSSICEFAASQKTRADSHSLRLIKTFTRLVEENTPETGTVLPETVYSCALRALTTTIMTHGTFQDSAAYKQGHYGGVGSPAFLREHLVPIYLPIMQNPDHEFHRQSYYIFMTMGDGIATQIMPALLQQLEGFKDYTNENKRDVETLVRLLNTMGIESKAAAPRLLELLLKPGEVDYEGDFGNDGKRAFNAELAAALVNIAGADKKYQRTLLKALNRTIAADYKYWEDKIRPVVPAGTTDLTMNLEQSRDKLLKLMGMEDADEMKHLF